MGSVKENKGNCRRGDKLWGQAVVCHGTTKLSKEQTPFKKKNISN